MRKKRSKILSMLLTLCMLTGLLPATAYAAEPLTISGNTDLIFTQGVEDSTGYSFTASAAGVDLTEISWSASGLPDGITTTTGAEFHLITDGVPTTPTDTPVSATITASATDSNGTMYEGNLAVTVMIEAEEEPTTEPLTDETFTVTYTDGVDGEEIFADQVYTVEASGALPYFDTSIGSLEREGYTYQGWTPALNYTVTADAIYTAVWTVDNTTPGFTVTYTDGVADEEIFEDLVYTDVESGAATPIYEGTPNRAGYTFAGWSPEVAATVTGNATYTAQWTADAPDTPDPLTISVSHTYLIGGGTITITTSKPAVQVKADDKGGLIEITTNNNINWTATIPGTILGLTYFIATDENGPVESEGVYLSPDFWIEPTAEMLIGGGTVTLITAVPVTSVTCDTVGISVQGSGDEWTATPAQQYRNLHLYGDLG